MGSICPATFQCTKQAVTAHEISNSYKLEEAASLGSTNKFQAFLEERTPKGGNGLQTLLHSLPPLLHQCLPPHPPPITERAARQQRRAAASEDAKPAAASSSDESDKEPESAQPPPSRPLSQPKSFGGKPRA